MVHNYVNDSYEQIRISNKTKNESSSTTPRLAHHEKVLYGRYTTNLSSKGSSESITKKKNMKADPSQTTKPRH